MYTHLQVKYSSHTHIIASTVTIHVTPVSFHPPADELVDGADHYSCSPLLDPSSSHPLIISAGSVSSSLLPPLPSSPSTDHLLSGLEERNSYVCSPPVPPVLLSVCVSVTKAADVSYILLITALTHTIHC